MTVLCSFDGPAAIKHVKNTLKSPDSVAVLTSTVGGELAVVRSFSHTKLFVVVAEQSCL